MVYHFMIDVVSQSNTDQQKTIVCANVQKVFKIMSLPSPIILVPKVSPSKNKVELILTFKNRGLMQHFLIENHMGPFIKDVMNQGEGGFAKR